MVVSPLKSAHFMQACLWLWATPQQYNPFWRNKLTFFIVHVHGYWSWKMVNHTWGCQAGVFHFGGENPGPTSSQTQRQELCILWGGVMGVGGWNCPSCPFSNAILWGTKQLQLTLAAVFQTFGKIWESVYSISFAFSYLMIKTWHWWGRLKTAPSKSKWHNKRFHRVGESCIVATPALISSTQNSKLRTCKIHHDWRYSEHGTPPIESRKSSQSVNPYYVWTW